MIGTHASGVLNLDDLALEEHAGGVRTAALPA